jgi:hypothetical protein
MLRHETEEVRQGEHPACPIDLVHAVRDVRRDVDLTDELDLVSHDLDPLGDLKCDDTAVTVTGDGVWSRRLRPLDCCGIAISSMEMKGDRV